MKHGYSTDNMPVITGRDCTKDAIAMIRSGDMSMSIFKSPKDLCGSIVDIAKKISLVKTNKTPKSESYDNGAKLVDTVLSYPDVVDKDKVNKFF